MDSLRHECIEYGIAFNDDTSKGSIGRKYARGDEIGIPYAITIDDQSCDPAKQLVTIRERDSCTQVQVKLADASEIVWKLIKGKFTWEHVYNTYPRFTHANENAEAEWTFTHAINNENAEGEWTFTHANENAEAKSSFI